MASENETVADIVKEKRDAAEEVELKGKTTFAFDLAKMLREEANRIEAAHKREVDELKHWIKSAARWIKCHDIYHTSGEDLIKQAKEILNDDGEFLLKKGEQ